MTEQAASALIELAERELARQIAIDCMKHFQQQQQSGEGAADSAASTKVKLHKRFAKEMTRHHDAIAAQLVRLLGAAVQKARYEGAIP